MRVKKLFDCFTSTTNVHVLISLCKIFDFLNHRITCFNKYDYAHYHLVKKRESSLFETFNSFNWFEKVIQYIKPNWNSEQYRVEHDREQTGIGFAVQCSEVSFLIIKPLFKFYWIISKYIYFFYFQHMMHASTYFLKSKTLILPSFSCMPNTLCE